MTAGWLCFPKRLAPHWTVYHYFRDGDGKSVCGHDVRRAGARGHQKPPIADRCAICVKKLSTSAATAYGAGIKAGHSWRCFGGAKPLPQNPWPETDDRGQNWEQGFAEALEQPE